MRIQADAVYPVLFPVNVMWCALLDGDGDADRSAQALPTVVR
ncbi:MAG: hypothetical protein SGI86_00630 [Deltaproteobacteria bacterium]|nr:hypothetical protein [Deltaproteobacteria bacterium]